MSRLTSQQNNAIQDEINGCFWQPKNAVNFIRQSCDKFEKFGAVVHLCSKVNSSEQEQLL